MTYLQERGRLAAFLGCLFLCSPAQAESPRIKILSARAGYPDARSESGAPIAKFGMWIPVDVEFELLGENTELLYLAIDTPDSDGIQSSLSLSLNVDGLKPGSTFRRISYVRPASSGETTLTVQSANGTPVSEPFRLRSLRPRDSLTYVVLSLGSKLPNFELPRPGSGDTESTVGPLRGGRVELGAISNADQLPDHWFGYESADLVVLSTSSPEFLSQLIGRQRKRAALTEWVSRGGRLAICVGTNAHAVRQDPTLARLIPSEISNSSPIRSVSQLPLYWQARENSQSSTLSGTLAVKSGSFPVANLNANLAARVVIPPAHRGTETKEPVAIQSAFGLGRTTIIGFDLDRPPFTEFPRQAEFWDWVLRECGASRTSVGSEGKSRQPNAPPSDDEDEVAVALRSHVDTFENIPVVTFGTVAFLIVLYIVLIAPIEYYFLKRILGRLEVTWITFPVIALTICVLSFLSASSMKGKELRVNKVDVVDVSAGPEGRVFGTTWVTVFSPRIDQFSVGIIPSEDWTKSPGESLVGWLGSPRAGRASLLQRKYAYQTDGDQIADRMIGVPIQIWSTKAFVANWTGRLDDRAPVVDSRLEHPVGDPTKAIGTFVNRMPFEAVTDCVAFYAGQAYPIGTIVKDQEVRLVLDHGQPAPQWFQERGQLADLFSRAQAFGGAAPAGSRSSGPAVAPSTSFMGLPLWGMLFHEASLRNDEGVVPRNASLRRLDQSWRLTADNRAEVIVVGRVAPNFGPLGTLFGGSESPSRLQLKDNGQSVPGFARQETYVRLYLPVK